MAHHFILLRLNPFDLSLGLIGRDGGLSTLCHSCGFTCQQRVLKTFPSPGCLHSEDGVVRLCHLLVNFYIYIYIYNLQYIHTYNIYMRVCVCVYKICVCMYIYTYTVLCFQDFNFLTIIYCMMESSLV